jgi:hypothetical protein|tara:strand:- start:839 stop:1399 length:561 start_codon:yes stop_codon:yes gene_type:complete
MEALIYFSLGAIVVVSIWLFRSKKLSFFNQNQNQYRGQKPTFNIRDTLSGELLCEGIIFGPTGAVNSRFVADMNAIWDGDKGIINERFVYDNGSVQDRKWVLTIMNSGKISAEASDLIGTGVGAQSGSTINLNYNIKLPEDAGGHELAVVDWMYLLPNGTIMNRSQFYKYGIKVGELVATIRKKDF